MKRSNPNFKLILFCAEFLLLSAINITHILEHMEIFRFQFPLIQGLSRHRNEKDSFLASLRSILKYLPEIFSRSTIPAFSWRVAEQTER